MKSLPPRGRPAGGCYPPLHQPAAWYHGRVWEAAPHGKAGSPERPLIRPSVRTGAPSPLWGEGFSVRLLLTFPLEGERWRLSRRMRVRLKRGLLPRSPPQSGSAGQLPRQGEAISSGRAGVVAPHKQRGSVSESLSQKSAATPAPSADVPLPCARCGRSAPGSPPGLWRSCPGSGFCNTAGR